MRIDGRTDTPNGKRFHIDMKRAFLNYAMDFAIPKDWMDGPDIQNDPNLRVLLGIRDEFLSHENRESRKEWERILIDFPLFVFHNDEYYRERMGYWIFQIIKHRDEFVYERLLTHRVGYDPEAWYGAKKGRGKHTFRRLGD